MRKVKEFFRKVDYRHYICILITIGFVCCSVFVFPNAWTRLVESFVDIWNSILYYFCRLIGIDATVIPTVNDYSSIQFEPILNMPQTWEEFSVGWSSYWTTFASLDNFLNYLSFIGNLILNIFKYTLLIVLPLILILFISFKMYFKKQNNKYNKDSKCLTFVKWLSGKTYVPIKNWLIDFWYFVKDSWYVKIWFLIWLYNFNIITICIEFIAFCFYFVISFDFVSIYRQVYKLCCDLSVMFTFVPFVFWLFIAYYVFNRIRKKIAYARLNHYERMNCGFINERPIVFMVCGTMGKKKTTAITDMALSQENMLKDKAFQKILENDLKFPFFPWVNLENALKLAMNKHIVYNLATIRHYIDHLKYMFEFKTKDRAVIKSIQRHLRKRYAYYFKDFIFEYDFNRYGLWYDDKLKMTNIWNVLETYSQLYFIYIIQSSLIISNYAIRTDSLIDDIGNFPLWNNDFFQKDSRLIDCFSRHSHILDFDSLRLGKKIVANNVLKDSFEFGVINITEIGKERKNNLELKDTRKNNEETNQKNDGFNDWLKMVRHSATVDNFPFVKVITDEQRPESWGADARDLLEIVHIKETSEIKLALPFFSLTEFLYLTIFNKFEELYHKYRYNRADNTLFMYLIKKLAIMFHNLYTRTYNTFGYYKLKVQVENGTQDGILNDKKYYLMSKKIYSKRFSTDCFSNFFDKKALNSKYGINDLKEYGTEKATFDELKEQHSYFISDLTDKQNEDK